MSDHDTSASARLPCFNPLLIAIITKAIAAENGDMTVDNATRYAKAAISAMVIFQLAITPKMRRAAKGSVKRWNNTVVLNGEQAGAETIRDIHYLAMLHAAVLS
jgi:hypothetical protein